METKEQSIIRKQNIEEQYFEGFVNQKEIKRYSFTALDHPYDAKFQSGITYCIGEIKVRKDRDIEYFASYGPYLELKKIEGMWKQKEYIKQNKGIDVQMLYFNFAENGLQIYYLNEPWTYNFNWKYLPKDNYEPDIKIWKLVAELKNPQEIIKKYE
jgi:hypothetical protein